MYFDRFDILSAYYLFGMLYHEGQGSKVYGYTSRVLQAGFRPGPFFDRHSLTENGSLIFLNLMARFHTAP